MLNRAPRIDVVVVTFNNDAVIDECLTSLDVQNYPLDRVSVIVVDNGSTDDSVDRVRTRHPRAEVVEMSGNRGFGAGVNAGIARGDGEIIVLLNSDARADPNLLSELVKPFNTHERIAAVTAKIILDGTFEHSPSRDSGFVTHDGLAWQRAPRGMTLLNSTGNQITRSGNGLDRDWLKPVSCRESPREVFGFSGGGAALRRSALDDVGLFDERLFMYYEDTDLSWRMRLAGWHVHYAPAGVVFHRHAASSDARSATFRTWNETNRVLVAVKNGTLGIAFRAIVRATFHAFGGRLWGARGESMRRTRALERRRRFRTLGRILMRVGPFALERRRTRANDRRRVARFAVPD